MKTIFFYQEPESSPDKKSWDKSNALNNKFSNGAESPKSVRKRFGSASEDTLLKVNGVNDGASFTAQEMEAFKVEIIKEVRKEFQKMKQEIIDGMKYLNCAFFYDRRKNIKLLHLYEILCVFSRENRTE